MSLANATCPLVSSCVTFPLYYSFSHSTDCASDLFPDHVANDVDRGSHLSKLDAIKDSIGVANNLDRDNWHAKFIAAMGRDWGNDVEAAKAIPEISPYKIQRVPVGHTEYLMVSPIDMTAPVMRGTSFSVTPPYDNRPFFTILLENISTGVLFTQTFQRLYSEEHGRWNPWIMHGGGFGSLYGVRVTEDHLRMLTDLVHGHEVTLPATGERFRLHCPDPFQGQSVEEILNGPSSEPPRSLCDRISDVFATLRSWW